jgi:hypothetical protein
VGFGLRRETATRGRVINSRRIHLRTVGASEGPHEPKVGRSAIPSHGPIDWDQSKHQCAGFLQQYPLQFTGESSAIVNSKSLQTAFL